jgi:glutamate 5-kinase
MNNETNTRIVIKIGTAILSTKNGIDESFIKKLSKLIANLKKNNYEVIIVSSGAIGCGYKALNLNVDMLDLANKQALASIGQPLLIATYQKCFNDFDILCSQLLCDKTTFKDSIKLKNVQNCIDTLLKNNIVPIFNENDALTTDEIVFGDNDQLSSYITYHTNSQILIMLSDINGFYDDNPRVNKNAKINKLVHEINQNDLTQLACANFKFATGGIVTKLKGANFLLKHKLKMFLCNGDNLNNVSNLLLDSEIKESLSNNMLIGKIIKNSSKFVGTLFEIYDD